MLKSMTGFGKREGTHRGFTIVVEVRSVNHRFREIVIRLPKGRFEWEEGLKALVAQTCRRGRIEVTVTCAGGEERGTHVVLDRPVARQYYQALKTLQKDFQVEGQIDIGLLASFRDIFRVVESPACAGADGLDDGNVSRAVTRLVSGAVADLDRMRSKEGKILQRDIVKRLTHVRRIHRSIRRDFPRVMKGLRERMRGRVQELSGSTNDGETRLTQECVLLADRCDVTEELTRLHSHVTQFDEMVRKREPVGRQLDFLLQEMGREVNTIGSKVNSAEISTHVVTLKSELEKIREQVQNVE